MNSFNKKPFIIVNSKNNITFFTLTNDVEYISDKYNDKYYYIYIRRNFSWSTSNIPEAFWKLLGDTYNLECLSAAMVYNWLCYNKSFIEKHRLKVSSNIFKDILKLCGVPVWRASIMAIAIYLWQCLYVLYKKVKKNESM